MGLLSSGAPITDTSALVRDRGLRVPRVGRLSYPRENLIDARQSAVSASGAPKRSTLDAAGGPVLSLPNFQPATEGATKSLGRPDFS